MPARVYAESIIQQPSEPAEAPRSIVLRTELPGPRSRELDVRRRSVVRTCDDVWMPMFADHGAGALLTDVDGNVFIDFAGGVGCLNTGHAHPRVVAAVRDAAGRFLHTDFTAVPYEGYVRLAERLLPLVPISGAKKAAFFNSGAAAVENAIKIAKAATGRPAVIAYEGGSTPVQGRLRTVRTRGLSRRVPGRVPAGP